MLSFILTNLKRQTYKTKTSKKVKLSILYIYMTILLLSTSTLKIELRNQYYNLTNMQDCQYRKKDLTDRFIPVRSSQKVNPNNINFTKSSVASSLTYQTLLSTQILEPMIDEAQTGVNSTYCMQSVKQLIRKREEVIEKKPAKRTLHLSPEKVLDAPEIRDDYYLNLLDWSSRGTLSIGLGERVYLYSPTNIRELCQKQDDYICSVAFNPTGDHLAVGLSSGKLEIYDTQREVVVRTIRSHTNRVSSSIFTYGMLFTGSKDTKILAHDYRSNQGPTMKFTGHRGEVCGLKHDACGLASGSNDNFAYIWDLTAGKARYQLAGHKAAVKALAWCPWQRNLLATGGGTSDQSMRFWNIENGKLIDTVNVDSQVCSLIWNKKDREILSSHGFSQNQLSLWKYPGYSKIADLHGHSQRVLHMVLSPDNSTVCTASADETLRFWKVFQGSKSFDMDEDKQNCGLSFKFNSLR